MPTAGFQPFVKIQLWGGGGGGGRGYGNTPGGAGAGGGYVEGVFACERGSQIEVFVGGGGAPGTASGGSGGKSLIGYEGARGGNAANSGYASGGGGGGGGATVAIINCKPVAVAGGGGGGGGSIDTQAGISASFLLNSNAKPNVYMLDQGKGWSGQDNSYYIGGGGGGGGGGMSGGGGGSTGSGVPGSPGHCGSNGAYPLDSLQSGEYCSLTLPNVPGGVTIAEYPGNDVAIGGYAAINGSHGGNGYAVITFYRESEMYVNDAGTYRRAEASIKMDNVFRPAQIYVKDGGVWKTTTSTATISFSVDAYKFGGTGLAYNAEYSIPNIATPSYSVWGYFDQSYGCYFWDVYHSRAGFHR